MKATFFKHTLNFITPGKTSRDVLQKKDSWFLVLKNNENYGIGECSIIPGLSLDKTENINFKLKSICDKISSGKIISDNELEGYPAIRFALEIALKDLNSFDTPFKLFNSDFSNYIDSIKINGLIWMGDIEQMKAQIATKIDNGFNCIKIKVGVLEFDTELELFKNLKKNFSKSDLEIRLDANGAFKKNHALEKLKFLSNYSIHSIEQPIEQNQWDDMAKLCELSPIPIALDEELIGVNLEREALLDTIKPQYLILKPSLLGGFLESDDWINLAEKRKINWWATSALESNVGLNAISQWVYTKNNIMKQGLGTGMLFKNNVNSPLEISSDTIFLNQNKTWDLNFFLDKIDI